MNCLETRPYLQAFVDNELSPERAIDVERHLGDCQECLAEVELTRSVCRATRTSVTGATSMCPEFQSRLCQCLAEERRRQEHAADRPLTWRVIAPLSAAAAVALFFGVHIQNQERLAGDDEDEDVARASASHDNLVDFLVQQHANGADPEARDPNSIAHLEPQLGFPVRAPDLDRFGAHFEGAQLVPVDRTRVAMLRYNLGGRRVTLYMYDPEQLPMRAQRALQPSVVGSHAVFIGNRKGYSIATCEQQGVGYAVTGDLSREESAELVAAVYR
jgi:anti-sigma factor RsiW